MKRADALRAMRFAGYHGDRATFNRLYIDHRISLATATDEFRAGERLRAGGMRCGCSECRETATDRSAL